MRNAVAAIIIAAALLGGCATPSASPEAAPTPVQVASQPTATQPPTSTAVPSPTPTITPANESCVRATTEIPEGQNPTRFTISGPASGCYDSVGGFLDDIGLEWEEFAPGTVITFWTEWPVDADGRVVYPTPTATRVPPTPTPRPWQTYRMQYAVRIAGVSKLWMPVPREWDGVGMKGVSVTDISPPPTDRYQDANGNEIAFWQIGDQNSQTYRVAFDVKVQPIHYEIDPRNIGVYDTTSPLYQRYTQPSSWVQSDHPEIVQQAQEIVGSETNPYYQARLLHRWVADSIGSGQPADALTALRTRSGDCGPHSFLLVAFLRALGIPARPVAGLGTIHRGLFESGSSREGVVYGHVWTEFYLPNYGWIQCDTDAGGPTFPAMNDPRIVLSRGDVIDLGPDYPLQPLAWLHSPLCDVMSDSTPPTATWGQELTLTVERTG